MSFDNGRIIEGEKSIKPTKRAYVIICASLLPRIHHRRCRLYLKPQNVPFGFSESGFSMDLRLAFRQGRKNPFRWLPREFQCWTFVASSSSEKIYSPLVFNYRMGFRPLIIPFHGAPHSIRKLCQAVKVFQIQLLVR